MAEAPRSSFIPKQTSSAVPSSVRRKRRFHAFNFLASALLALSLALGAGSYFYRNYAGKQLEQAKSDLSFESERFSENDIAEVREFDRTLEAARLLLDNHISPSKIFDALELKTMDRVQFSSFSFQQRPSQDVTLTVEGGTEEFKTVALQALQFGDDPLLSDAVFTDLGTQGASVEALEAGQTQPSESHRISFSVIGDIASSLLVFEPGSFGSKPSFVEPVTEDTSSDVPENEEEDEQPNSTEPTGGDIEEETEPGS